MAISISRFAFINDRAVIAIIWKQQTVWQFQKMTNNYGVRTHCEKSGYATAPNN